jgi:hypothetical protein
MCLLELLFTYNVREAAFLGHGQCGTEGGALELNLSLEFVLDLTGSLN